MCKMLTFCSENSGPFQLHHAHVRKDTRLSPCNHVLERESLGTRLLFFTYFAFAPDMGLYSCNVGWRQENNQNIHRVSSTKMFGGGSILKNEKFGSVACCTILISELSHHVRATFCATFGILFPYVLSLENYICSNDVVYLFGGEPSPPRR